MYRYNTRDENPISRSLLQLLMAASIILAMPTAYVEAEADAGFNLRKETTKEFEGRIIKRIVIDNQDIFDFRKQEENKAIHHAANYLHMRTKKPFIARQLLFSVGDIYQQRVVNESARLIRQNKYIADAEIYPKVENGELVVYVVTRDTWSTKPTISFGHTGGKSKSSIGLEEDNFLGTGVHLGFSFVKDIDRDSIIFEVYDRQLGSSWYQLGAQYQSNSDGHLSALNIEQPFYAYSTKGAIGFYAEDLLRQDDYFYASDAIYSYQTKKQEFNVYKGFSHVFGEGRLRHSIGVHTELLDFDEILEQPNVEGILEKNFISQNNLLPEDRDETYPYYQVEYIQDKYVVDQNIHKISRTEDIYSGLGGKLLVGIGQTEEQKLMRVSLEVNYTQYITENLLLSSNVFSSFDYLSEDGVVNQKRGYDIDLLYGFNEHFKLYAQTKSIVAKDLYKDEQLFLGGENGFRGYPLRYASGDKLRQFTIEQRYYSDYNPLNILNFGAAVFFDIGKVGGAPDIGEMRQRHFSVAGIGLRLTSNRSSKGDLIHIDLSYPLDKEYDDSKWQFSIMTKAKF